MTLCIDKTRKIWSKPRKPTLRFLLNDRLLSKAKNSISWCLMLYYLYKKSHLWLIGIKIINRFSKIGDKIVRFCLQTRGIVITPKLHRRWLLRQHHIRSPLWYTTNHYASLPNRVLTLEDSSLREKWSGKTFNHGGHALMRHYHINMLLTTLARTFGGKIKLKSL